MSIDGLHYILEKSEVVATASALDLRDRPEAIESGYLRHVRTFVPMSRLAEGTGLNVGEFEAKLLKRTREGKAPRGYIAAGYGYGKTSTALHLWQRAEADNLLAVPPFQLEKLDYLLTALHGWARYRLLNKRPALVPKLDDAFAQVAHRSLEQIARQNNLPLEQAQAMYQSGLLNLEVRPNDYVDFFAEVTRIAEEAGFAGVLLIADEIQQFIRPRIQQQGDTIAPLFNILQRLGTHETDSSLKFGFLLSITLEEIGIIRDVFRRGDLLARLKELSMDLSDVYTTQFARTLWHRLAETFDFTAEADHIIDDFTLDALGNISANREISDGPRTVVNVLKRAVAVYLQRREARDARPYSPLDLMEDFLDEQTIYFAGNDRLRTVTRQRLAHPLVAAQPARFAPAIKLIAAFGVEGVPTAAIEHYEQAEPIDALMQHAIGDLVRVGSNFAERLVALVGLNSAADPDWMKETIRNFRLGWNPYSPETKARTFHGLAALLQQRVFPKAKFIGMRESTLTDNFGLVLELDLQGVSRETGTPRKYPKRRLHIRLLWDDEPVKDAGILGDVCLEFRLNHHQPMGAAERKRHYGQISEDAAAHTITVPLNLYYLPDGAELRPLHQNLQDVWSPYDLTPIVQLNLYQMLDELHTSDAMPKQQADVILNSAMPEFLEFALADLFNAGLGESALETAGADMANLLASHLIEQRYPDYITLMGNANWVNMITKYKAALGQLDTALQRYGQEEVVGTKTRVAELFGLANTGLDSFIASYGTLLKATRDLNKPNGAVLFTLSPLEQRLFDDLRASELVVPAGKVTAHRLSRAVAKRTAMRLGYQDEEVEKAFDLLIARGLATLSEEFLTEVVNQALDMVTLQAELRAIKADVDALSEAFPSNALEARREATAKAEAALAEQAAQKNPNADTLEKLSNLLRKERQEVNGFAKDRLNDQIAKGKSLASSIAALRANEMASVVEPLADEVEYTDLVNVLRTKLLDRVEQVKKRTRDYQSEIQRARDALRPDIAIASLAQTAARLDELQREQEDMQKRISQARDWISHFERWRALAKEGAALQRQMAEDRLVGVAEAQAEFKQFAADLRGEISARKLEALEDHAQFTAQLDAIRRHVDELRKQATTQFNAQRDWLVGLLSRMKRTIPPELQQLPFNPSNPQSAYTMLEDRARSGFKAALDELMAFINQRQVTAQAIERQVAGLAARESKVIAEQVAHLATAIAGLQQRAAQLSQGVKQFDDSSFMMQYAEELVETYLPVRAEAERLHKALETERSKVTQLQPTALEKIVLDKVQALLPSGGQVDVFTLRAAFGDDEDFWDALRGLVDKDCVAMSVALPTRLDDLT